MKPFPPRRILAPVDLFEPLGRAARAARDLAGRWNVPVDFAFVYPMPQAWAWPEELMPVPLTPLAEEGPARAWIEKELGPLTAALPKRRARLRGYVGPPASVIAGLAGRARANDLVVVGTHGLAGLERALAGSVAEAAARRSRAPVLILRDGAAAFRPKSILVPWNGAPYADRALVYAAAVGRALRARVTAMYVSPPEEGLPRVSALERRVAALAPEVPLKVYAGDPRRQILAEAERGGFDLIVLSAHRKPFWKRWAFGSTAEHVLRHGNTALLAVPSGPTSRT